MKGFVDGLDDEDKNSDAWRDIIKGLQSFPVNNLSTLCYKFQKLYETVLPKVDTTENALIVYVKKVKEEKQREEEE